MICRKCHNDVPDAPYCCQCGAKQNVTVTHKPKVRGNGQGTVFKRGNKWVAQKTLYTHVVETEDGKLHKKRKYVTKGGFLTKKDAVNFLPSLGTKVERKVPKLIDLWEQYEKNGLKKVSASKQTAYQIARRRLESIIGYPIDTLTTAIMQNAVNEGSTSYYTAKDMKSVLSHLFKIAIADGYVAVNLSEHIVLPELIEHDAEPFTEAEVDTMWAKYADGEWFVGYLLLMIYSGMMPGELFACKKEMIDLDRREIWGCGKKTKRRKKETPIIFADCVLPVVVELCETVDGDMLQPLPKNDWYDRYHKVVKKIGVRDLPPYSCRHTTGTEAAKQNLNAATIQKIMRHAKISTSQRYIHFGSEEAHTGINAIKKTEQK